VDLHRSNDGSEMRRREQSLLTRCKNEQGVVKEALGCELLSDVLDRVVQSADLRGQKRRKKPHHPPIQYCTVTLRTAGQTTTLTHHASEGTPSFKGYVRLLVDVVVGSLEKVASRIFAVFTLGASIG